MAVYTSNGYHAVSVSPNKTNATAGPNNRDRLNIAFKNIIESTVLFSLAKIFGKREVVMSGSEDEVELAVLFGKDYWIREIL